MARRVWEISKKTHEQRDTDTAKIRTERHRDADKDRERERYGGYGSESADSGGESKRYRRGEAESEIVLGEVIEERFRVKFAW